MKEENLAKELFQWVFSAIILAVLAILYIGLAVAYPMHFTIGVTVLFVVILFAILVGVVKHAIFG